MQKYWSVCSGGFIFNVMSRLLGTPGTGKSTLSQQICENNELDWVEVGKIAKDEKLFEGYDSHYGCHVLNEEKVLPWLCYLIIRHIHELFS